MRVSNEKKTHKKTGPWGFCLLTYAYICMINDPVVFLSIYLGEQKGDYLALNIYMSFKMPTLLEKEFQNTYFSIIMFEVVLQSNLKIKRNKICKTTSTVKVQTKPWSVVKS